ncbi:hypothetical protein Hamer_G007583 [Homarus americanus]|uniref:Uncharacterized protein n=1 Tax=Homarus americanus TaxID=6706 RepID=A0A8J5JR32_HOMAM|nr:hypothetical protein Hamer_G007583 [Homarus americanus]
MAAVGREEADDLPVCYYSDSGLLLGKFRPPLVPAGEDWLVNKQMLYYYKEALVCVLETQEPQEQEQDFLVEAPVKLCSSQLIPLLKMARHILPLVLLVVALVVRLILSAPIDEDVEVNSIHHSFDSERVASSIFNNIANIPCRRKCYIRDYHGRCRRNFSCLMG